MSTNHSERRILKRLRPSLLSLRLGIGVVFVMWTLDKFVNPGHAAAVFERFYGIESLSHVAAYAVGAFQALLVLAFVLGAYKNVSYTAIVLMHGVSTLSTFGNYLAPWDVPNLLFFAAIPTLAAAVTLWLLRDLDTIASVDAWLSRPATKPTSMRIVSPTKKAA